MDQHSGESAGHGGHGGQFERRAATPSAWPILGTIAAALLGLSLFWAASEDNEDATVPVVAGAAAFVVTVAVGWAYEAGALRRRSTDDEAAQDLVVRNTQVITFAVPEGSLEAARAEDGVITALDKAVGGLQSLPGFQDLRVTLSAAEAGSSQVLVETTWASRAALAGYEGGKSTLLDLIAARGDQVVPGTVQTFDMDVVRDTKSMPARFTFAHATAAIAALVIGGLGVGVVAALGDDGGGGGVAPTAGPTVDPYAVVSTDNKFDKKGLEAPPSTEVTFTLTNDGKVKHNLHFYDAKDGSTLAPGAEGEIIEGDGAETSITFTTPGPGTYYFQCDLHPTEMFGDFTVREGAPPPGGAAGEDGGASGSPTVVATDNKFDLKTIEAPANSEFSITIENEGKIKHNIHFLDKKDGKTLAPGAEGEFIDGGTSETLTFTTPGPGTYYFQCDLHPAEMSGDFVVK